MRIGIDARELAGRVTGVGRFLGGILREWQRDDRALAHEFILYAPSPPGVSLNPARFRVQTISGGAGTWWEQYHLPDAITRDALDVFFAPAYTSPLRVNVPVVAAIYDLSYVAHPEWFRLREGLRRRWLTTRTAAMAHTVITVSEFSRREIVERLHVPPERVRVVVPGLDLLDLEPRHDATPRVLFVGSIFNRRHVPELIHAVAALADRHPTVSLDIVGDNRTYPREDLRREILQSGLGDRGRWHQYVSDEQLRDLYSRARAFAFLSEYEGLGMTPLEALGAGIPSVLFDTPVAREACGEAALYVRIKDRAATEWALEKALFDEKTREAVFAARPAVLAKYQWPRAASETLGVLETAAHSR
jgi:glycosyltransferase involved in cell wall biosynthesis